jgi:hypothetical protein
LPIFSRHWRHQQTGAPDPNQLRVTGPALQVEISIPTALAAALQQANQQFPQPHVGIALIDTGASMTNVDVGILQGLGLSPTGTVAVATPSATSVQQPTYACVLSFPGTPLPPFPFNVVIGSQLAGFGVAALIGRDVLAFCQLVYNGPEGFWTIAY